jgi:hypothetical protein
VYGLITVVIQASGSCNSPFIIIGFGKKMSEKRKSVSPSAIQVKKQQKTINAEDKLDIISQLEKGERIS